MRLLLPILLIIFLKSLSTSLQGPAVRESGIKELKWDTAPAPTPLRFEEERIESYKKSAEFEYVRDLDQENWWSRLKRYLGIQYQKLLDRLFVDYEANSILAFILKLLPYLIIAGILYLAYWIFNRMNPAAIWLGKNESPKVFLSEDEEIIKTSDISALIEEAVTQRNYRLAIRYYFLLILQQLTKKKLIAYESSKTDEEYIKEIKSLTVQQQFKQLTRIYNFVWYGSFDATETHYLRSKREFEKMQDLIQHSHE